MSKTAAAAPEPSMEDILASIRKIITDDEPAKQAEEKAVATQEAKPEMDEMASAMAEPEVVSPAVEMAEPDVAQAIQAETPAVEDEDVFDLTGDMVSEQNIAPTAESVSEAQQIEEPARVMQFDEEEDIVFVEEEDDAPTQAASESAMRDIPVFATPIVEMQAQKAQTVQAESTAGLISQNVTEAIGSQFSSLSNLIFSQNARTLDDVVQDMMKPMLKSWLDQNLPALVERLVQEEIERVTRGRR